MTFLLAFFLLSQNYTQRGFIESQFTLYPQNAPNDSGHVVAEELVRYESFYKPIANLEIAGGIDVRMDTHHQVERELRFSWLDRERQRPLAAVRRLSALYNLGGLTVEAGKQFVRWGKADIVTPTDRFAPRDFLAVVENDFLAISALRATYERGSNTFDVVWSPRFTPSRTPLVNQRWFTAPANATALTPVFPDGQEAGLRWSHVGEVEYSFSYYRGFNHAPPYPGIQMFGGDAALPLEWLTLKMEIALFDSRDARSDEYVQYVLQLERQTGEWSFVGGYAGEIVTERQPFPTFDPDRGLTKTLLGRAGYTIDANRSIALEAAVRQDASGAWGKLEYSHAFGQHWRVTTGVGLLGGKTTDFLGQYRRNSHGLVAIRYSF